MPARCAGRPAGRRVGTPREEPYWATLAEVRIRRQGAGTCPVLIIGVTESGWDGMPFTGVP